MASCQCGTSTGPSEEARGSLVGRQSSGSEMAGSDLAKVNLTRRKIILLATHGTAGPFAITCDTGYEFSAGLPKPNLSTTAGQTDLLGYVYNAAKGKWLLVAFVNGF